MQRIALKTDTIIVVPQWNMNPKSAQGKTAKSAWFSPIFHANSLSLLPREIQLLGVSTFIST
jgi:hypothetical protein